MRIKVSLLLLMFVLLNSCKTQKKATESVSAELVMDESFRKPVNDKILFAQTNDMVPLDTAFIVMDTLHIITKRILGCDAENFKLIWNGNKTKSLPPQASVKLFQQVEGACKERHRFHLLYNVSSLHLKQDTTIIKVGGWKNSVTLL